MAEAAAESPSAPRVANVAARCCIVLCAIALAAAFVLVRWPNGDAGSSELSRTRHLIDAGRRGALGTTSDRSAHNTSNVTTAAVTTPARGPVEDPSLPLLPRCLGSRGVVVGVGDSLAREFVNALLPYGTAAGAGAAPFAKRSQKASKHIVTDVDGVAVGYADHLAHRYDDALPTHVLEAALAMHPQRPTVVDSGDKRTADPTASAARELYVLSYGAWPAFYHGAAPSTVFREVRDALLSVLLQPSAESASDVRRVVVYVPHCRPRRVFALAPQSSVCWSGERGYAFRRAVACAAARAMGASATRHGPRIDVYDACGWALRGDDVYGGTKDGLHFRAPEQRAVAEDILGRFGGGCPGSRADGPEAGLAWATDGYATHAEAAAAVSRRYRCAKAFDDELLQKPSARSVEGEATLAGTGPRTCRVPATAADDKLRWAPSRFCVCGRGGAEAEIADACLASHDTVLAALRNRSDISATVPRMSAVLCGPRAALNTCVRMPEGLSGLDLQTLAPASPAFAEAVLTACLAPEAIGLCLLNHGAALGFSEGPLAAGEVAVREVLARFANVTYDDSFSVCRCGFSLSNDLRTPKLLVNGTQADFAFMEQRDGRAAGAQRVQKSKKKGAILQRPKPQSWCQRAAQSPAMVDGVLPLFRAVQGTLAGAATWLGCNDATLHALELCAVSRVRRRFGDANAVNAAVQFALQRRPGPHRWRGTQQRG